MAVLQQVINGPTPCSGAALQLRALRAARGMARLGIGRGDRIALLLRNDLPFLEATLAAQHLGAYAVPLNWHATVDELLYVLDDCRPQLLLVHADLLGPTLRARSERIGAAPLLVAATPPEVMRAYRIDPIAGEVPPGAIEWSNWVAAQPPDDSPPVATPESLIYTSGTSGKPKGVRRDAATAEQGALTEHMRCTVSGIDASARVLVAAPLYHTAPNMYALRAVRHAQLLVLPARFDAEALLADIERHRITHLYAVATMFSRLLALPEAQRRRHDLSSLRFVLHAGGPCAPEIKRAMLDWWGPIVHEYYGSTEAGPITFCTGAEWLEHPGSVGRAVGGAHLVVLDEAGKPVPPGQIGEVCARNTGYPDFSYLNQPEARAELQRGEFVATGDLGWLDDDGYLYLSDRKKDLIISGGVNIYPAEIEAVLLAIDGVADCAVFGIPDRDFGEAVAAIVQPMPGHALSETSLCDALKARLAAFKLPRLIELREALPREESGKIRKRLLREPYWAETGRKI